MCSLFGGLSGLSSDVVLQSMMKPVFLLSLAVVWRNSALAICSFCHVVSPAAGQAQCMAGGLSVSKTLC